MVSVGQGLSSSNTELSKELTKVAILSILGRKPYWTQCNLLLSKHKYDSIVGAAGRLLSVLSPCALGEEALTGLSKGLLTRYAKHFEGACSNIGMLSG